VSRLPDAKPSRRPSKRGDTETVDAEEAAQPKPFLKWAGGKWSLAEEIGQRLPADLASRTYREPFLGGGAMFFWLKRRSGAKRYVLSDALADLVTTYEVVRDHPEELIRTLEALRDEHTEQAHETYYRIRERYNERRAGAKIERAAWLIYLNKTCFNGLYRTNRSGLFNVPIGRFVRPNIADAARLRAASDALGSAALERAPFDHLRRAAKKGDVIYLDPPYVPLSATSNFDSYSGGAFGLELQEELASLFRTLDERGCLLIQSNSDTPEVRRLYEGFDVDRIDAPRHISSRGATRGPVTEVVIRNLKSWPKTARPRSPR
jgi:DNA adenine methylase